MELLISCLQICPDIHHIFPIPAHNRAMKNASLTMIPTFDPFHIRQETWENCIRTCHVLFLFTVHIKGVSSMNTFRTLIFHYLTTPFWPLVLGGGGGRWTEERRPWIGYIFRAEPHSNPHTLQLCPPCVPCPYEDKQWISFALLQITSFNTLSFIRWTDLPNFFISRIYNLALHFYVR